MNSGLVSHWELGTWAPGETRLHWYLLPTSAPAESVDSVTTLLDIPGIDVVPAEWLHCTVVALRPSLASADRAAVDHMVDSVRSSVAGLGPIGASATLEAHHSAVVWSLTPVHAFRTVFEAVVPSCGPMIRTDVTRPYQPHLTVAYSRAVHETASIEALMRDETGALPSVEFSTLALLDVRRQDSCYQWDVVEQIELR